MCNNPKKLYRKGKYKENNYNGKKGEEYEICTFTKCGYCEECINEKSNNWVIRNYYESKAHTEKCFITLTYKENPLFLLREDIQKFNKRLRKAIYKKYKKNIKIFYLGDYGQINNRPHFHEIIYGWEDENAEFERYNKKLSPIYESELIKKTWGKGLISYQPFSDNELPYVALYESKRNEISKGFLITREKAKELIKKLNDKKNDNRLAQIRLLKEKIKESEKEKTKYICIKEFQGWSKALGWKEFEKEYKNEKIKDFQVYIKDKEFLTPTPWIKKLANRGDKEAIKEMRRRASETSALRQNTTELKNKNLTKSAKYYDKEELIKFAQKKHKIEEF